ncbi:MAG: flagellar biosynthetic protein FliR [Rubellimicrobium sp.]|nr:flagellar biosynthetic protein FliR [Rubellimicrobium sp.]
MAAALAALAAPWGWAALLVLLRVGAVVALAPGFGEQGVPVRIRLAVAAGFALCVLPAVGADMAAPTGAAAGLGMALAEVLAGLLFGAALRLLVLALQTAGAIAAQSVSLAQIAGGGITVDPAPATGHLLVSGGIALAMAAGLHLRLVAYLIESYVLVPAGTFPSAETVATAGTAAVAHSFALAFSLALPFVIAALLYNIALGLINRAMPQLMVTFIGAPFLTGGSIVLLLGTAPLMLGLWAGALERTLATPFPAP